jgi:hypothetical protein
VIGGVTIAFWTEQAELSKGRIQTKAEALAKHFEDMDPAGSAIENDTPSVWINE